MRVPSIFRPKAALVAIAAGLCASAIAQPAPSAQDNAAAPPAATTQTQPDANAPGAAQTPRATAPATGPNAPIGSTTITRSDSSNQAFEKLDKGNTGFVTAEQASQLPGFGGAFAKADRDRDDRLDRTEFVDAWSYYTGEGQGVRASSEPASASPAAQSATAASSPSGGASASASTANVPDQGSRTDTSVHGTGNAPASTSTNAPSAQ